MKRHMRELRSAMLPHIVRPCFGFSASLWQPHQGKYQSDGSGPPLTQPQVTPDTGGG